MPPEVAYVFQMSQQARPRLVVVMETDVHTVGIIEWREDQGHILEKLTFDVVTSMDSLPIGGRDMRMTMKSGLRSTRHAVTIMPLGVMLALQMACVMMLLTFAQVLMYLANEFVSLLHFGRQSPDCLAGAFLCRLCVTLRY